MWDKWALVCFILILLTLHIIFGAWFAMAYSKILKLCDQEVKYLETINSKFKRTRKSVYNSKTKTKTRNHSQNK